MIEAKINQFLNDCNVTESQYSDLIQSFISDDSFNVFHRIDSPQHYAIIRYLDTDNELKLDTIEEYDYLLNYLEDRSDYSPCSVVGYNDIKAGQRERFIAEYADYLRLEETNLRDKEVLKYIVICLKYPEYAAEYLRLKERSGSDLSSFLKWNLYPHDKSYGAPEYFLKHSDSNLALYLTNFNIEPFIFALEHKFHCQIRQYVELFAKWSRYKYVFYTTAREQDTAGFNMETFTSDDCDLPF
jgi:hypothetical protein